MTPIIILSFLLLLSSLLSSLSLLSVSLSLSGVLSKSKSMVVLGILLLFVVSSLSKYNSIVVFVIISTLVETVLDTLIEI